MKRWFYNKFYLLVAAARERLCLVTVKLGRIGDKLWMQSLEEKEVMYMTANQIEYWKLQETRRHNIETENIDRPYKDSMRRLNEEYIINQPYVRALTTAQERAAYAQEAAGYASAEASMASAALSYERIATEETVQALNLQKSATESTIQGYNEARTRGVDISNQQQEYVTSTYQYSGLIASDKVNYLDFNTNNRAKGAKATVNREWYNPQGAAANAFNSGMYTAAVIFGQ